MALKGKHVTVFGGSRLGASPSFAAAAFEIGARLADCGAIVVNGGGNSGLMHQTLEGAISRGGRVKGIITQRFMDQGEGHVQAFKEGDLIIVDNMTDRKRLLYEAGEAFIALPGGLGTIEETAEILSWRNLDLHQKPIVLCDTSCFYSQLHSFITSTVQHGFTSGEALAVYSLCATPELCIKYLEQQFSEVASQSQ